MKHYCEWHSSLGNSHPRYFFMALKSEQNYLKKVVVGQIEWLNQVPCEPRLRIKITEYLESLVSVISDGIQSRGGEPGCFIILTASSQLNLAVFTNKRYRTGTVVPNIWADRSQSRFLHWDTDCSRSSRCYMWRQWYMERWEPYVKKFIKIQIILSFHHYDLFFKCNIKIIKLASRLPLNFPAISHTRRVFFIFHRIIFVQCYTQTTRRDHRMRNNL